MSVAPTLQTRRPRWWLEILAIVWLLWVYDAITNLASVRAAASYDHARSVLHLEQSLHLDPEHALNAWLAPHHTLGLWVSDYYDNAHFVVTLAVIGWLWWRHSDLYRPLRRSIVLINVMGFVVFWLYPMAPPRLLAPTRYKDIVAATHAIGSWHSGALSHDANQYAAMPSLHLGWAVWSAYAVWSVFRGHKWSWLAWIYPMITAYAVMATGNHFLSDVVAGVADMVLATIVANHFHPWEAARKVLKQRREQAAGRDPLPAHPIPSDQILS